MASEKTELIKKQVEFYLSDKNLSTDAFFHNKISEDKEGYIDLGFIMNCNKLKQLTEDQEEVIEAIKDSTEIEHDKGKAFINHICTLYYHLINIVILIYKFRRD
jgi:hypothetical protein